MDTNPSITVYGLSFTALCAIMWFVPEPKFSAVCGLLILIGWDITFHLREIIALQKEQLHDHRVAKLTADKIEEYATLAEQTLELHKERIAIQRRMLVQYEKMVDLQTEMVVLRKEMAALQRRIVPATERIEDWGYAGDTDEAVGCAAQETKSGGEAVYIASS
ncbi:hypothetical protein N0V85_006824 [Neurospora sp. IMI 360204]|nr:hypothetical protein N0V85_006824 [Neurospora sp. IMI 360204]